MTVSDETRNEYAPAEMIAGWLNGISGNTVDLRDKINACYKTNTLITNDFYDAMEAYEKRDMATGGAKT